MNVDRFRRAWAIALGASLALASFARADMLTNGGFESGAAVPATGILAVPPGSPALTGWTVLGGAINIVTNDYWACLSGVRSVELSSSGPGAIQQTFTSVSGSVYRLTFSMSGEPFSVPTIKNLRVQAGATTQDYTFDVTPAWHWDMKWQQHTLDFTAPGPSTTVTLTSLDAGAAGPAIDATSIDFVSADVGAGPARLALAPVAPDPLRGEGRVWFTLPVAQSVRLSVVDLQGREVARLARGALAAGPHELTVSARSIGLRSGLYFLVLETGERTIVRRFTTLQ
jgi:choice-of-anchor C domain-containing protein